MENETVADLFVGSRLKYSRKREAQAAFEQIKLPVYTQYLDLIKEKMFPGTVFKC